MKPPIDPIQQVIQSAMDALKQGDRITAHRLAEEASQLAPENETPWLILAAMAEPEASLTYAQKALQLNPNSKVAQHAVEWAVSRQPAESPQSESEPIEEEVQQSFQSLPTEMEPSEKEDQLLPQEREPQEEGTIPSEEFSTWEPEFSEEESPLPAQSLNKTVEPSQDLTGAQVTPSPIVTPVPIAAPRAQPTSKQARPFHLLVVILLILLGIIILMLAVGWIFFRPQILDLIAGNPGNSPCSLSLYLGEQIYPVETLIPAKDGSIKLPENQPNHAYWVKGTDANLEFLLSPVTDGQSLISSLGSDGSATVTRENCNTTTYNLFPAAAGELKDLTLVDPSSQITIFIPASSGASGIILRGEISGETILPSSTSTESE